MKLNIKLLIRVFVSFILLFIFIYLAGPKQIYNELLSGNILYMFYGLLLITFGTLVSAYRWYIVMKTLGFSGNFSFYLKSYFVGIFFNQLLPSSIGGDAVRVLDVSKLGYKKRTAFVGVLVDRGVGIAGIFIVNLVFNNMFNAEFLPKTVYHILNIISLIGIAGFISFMFLHKISFLNKYNWYKLLSVPSEALFKVSGSIKGFIFQLGASVFVHILTFTGVYMISRAFGVDLALWSFMIIMPPIILLTIIPISLAGWGVREAGMVGMLKYAGISQETALSISLIFGFTYIIQGLAGFYFWIMRNKKNTSELKQGAIHES